MDVFAYYDCSPDAPADQADMVTLWERSWRARGWSPRLITARHARRSRFYKKHHTMRKDALPLIALHAVGGGWLSPLGAINFNFPVDGVEVRGCVFFNHGVTQATKTALDRHFRNGTGARYSLGGCFIYGDYRWPKAPLVIFSNPHDALNCGRPF